MIWLTWTLLNVAENCVLAWWITLRRYMVLKAQVVSP
jgi:hypothetical protein